MGVQISVSISIYTDGGCKGNPGLGAWAFVVDIGSPGTALERSGYNPSTTNNRMELQAVIEALQWALEMSRGQEICIHLDSQYVQKGISEWIKRWKRNNWKTSAKKPVKNKDLWLELDALNEQVKPEWRWVQGHAGIELNERCDTLVKNCMELHENA